MKINGKCHCGNISYQAEIDPNLVAICHCSDCQTLSATAFRTIVPVPTQNFKLTGQVKIYIKTGESGAKRQQAFCPNCETGIYATSAEENPEFYNIRLGTAQQKDQLVPKAQYWSRSALGWLGQLEATPKQQKQ